MPASRALLSVDQPFSLAHTWMDRGAWEGGRDLALPRDWVLVPWLLLEDVQGQH